MRYSGLSFAKAVTPAVHAAGLDTVHSIRRLTVESGNEARRLLRLMQSVVGLWHSGARPLGWLNGRLIKILPDRSLVFCDDGWERLLQIVGQIYLQAQTSDENMERILRGLQAIIDRRYAPPRWLRPFAGRLPKKSLVLIADVAAPFESSEWRVHLTSPWLDDAARSVIAPGSNQMTFWTPGSLPRMDRLEYEIRDYDATVSSRVGSDTFSVLCDIVAQGPWNKAFDGWRDELRAMLMYTFQAVLLHTICHALVGGSDRWTKYLGIWQRGGNYPLGYFPSTKNLIVLADESSPR